jgi:hypothetical protein
MDATSVRTMSLAHPETMLIRAPTNTARMRDIELALKRDSRKTWLKSGPTTPMLGGKHRFTVDFSFSAFPFVPFLLYPRSCANENRELKAPIDRKSRSIDPDSSRIEIVVTRPKAAVVALRGFGTAVINEPVQPRPVLLVQGGNIASVDFGKIGFNHGNCSLRSKERNWYRTSQRTQRRRERNFTEGNKGNEVGLRYLLH